MSEEKKTQDGLNLSAVFADMKKFGITYLRMGDLEVKLEPERKTLEDDYQQPDYSRGFK